MKNKRLLVKRTLLAEKMILYFLTLGIGSIVLTGIFSFFTARNAILDRTYDQLTSIRLTRQAQIERFFADRLSETAYYASTEETKQLLGKVKLAANHQKTKTQSIYRVSFLSSAYYSGFMLLDKEGRNLYQQITNQSNITDQIPIRHSFHDIQPQAFIVDYTQEETENEKQLLSAAPIYNDNRIAGYLVLILKPGKINDFMLEVNPANGLGNTGETYLVGPDFLMRSQSRFIEKSIMKTYVKTRPVTEALNNRAGTAQVTDYRGLKVLSSYGLVKTAGLNWVILAEIDYEEATASIYGIRNNIMLLTVFTGIAFFILTYAISRKITKPLIRLKDAAIELGEGRLDTLVGIESNDEIGELTEAFNSMAVSLREKDEALKAERINRLKSAIDGQDMERQRLSRELHDGIGQNLIAIRLRLGALENDIPDKLNQKIQSVITLTDSLIDEVRAISNALMPPALAEFGLTTAIRNLCSNLTETTGITTEFTGEIPGQKLGRKARLYIFRIFQETFNNVAKHSEATHLKIETKTDAHIFIITITDNGKGFNVESPCASGGHGLGNMVERANLLKGQATIQSSPGSGTLIRIEIPLNKSIL